MSDDDEPEIIPYTYNPSQKLESFKQLQKKEEFYFMKNSKNKFIELENSLNEKNSYFAKAKVPEINAYDQLVQKEEEYRKFKDTKKIDLDFCKKCPVFKNHCPHKKQSSLIKEKFPFPITTSSAYGWLPEYDRFKENFKLNKATKDFYNSSHL